MDSRATANVGDFPGIITDKSSMQSNGMSVEFNRILGRGKIESCI